MIDDDWEDETTDVVRFEHGQIASEAKSAARRLREMIAEYIAETEPEG